jgi:drug/metabolite transporter (DMT)-like permease
MATADDRSLGELMAELSRDTGTLVRKEFELATTELTARAREVAGHAAIAAVGAALLHAGVLVVLAALVIALTQMGMQPWLAAVIVAALAMIGGYVMMNSGVSRIKNTSLAPRQTIETLRENAKWTTGQRA